MIPHPNPDVGQIWTWNGGVSYFCFLLTHTNNGLWYGILLDQDIIPDDVNEIGCCIVVDEDRYMIAQFKWNRIT